STVNRTRERVEDQIGAVKEQITTVRGRIETGTDKAREAIDTSRKKVRGAREEIERRVGEAKSGNRDSAGKLDAASDRGISASLEAGVDVVITDVAEEGTTGRSDLG